MRNVYINKVAVFLPNKPVSIVDHFWQQETCLLLPFLTLK